MNYVESILHCYCFPSHTWSVLIDQLLNNTKVHIVRSSFKNVNCDSQIANWFSVFCLRCPHPIQKNSRHVSRYKAKDMLICI